MQLDRRTMMKLGAAASLATAGCTTTLPAPGAAPGPAASSNDAFPMFSDAEMARRHTAVRTEMARRNIDALLVYGHTSLGTSVGQVNLQYLARYAAVIETYLVLPAAGDPTLFLAIRYHIPNARRISYVQDVRSGDALALAIARLRDLGLGRGRIGLVGPGHTSRSGVTLFVEQKDRLAAGLPDAAFENFTTVVDDLRLAKSPEELAVMRRAGAITDRAHELLFQSARAGVTPVALRRKLDAFLASEGATAPFGHIGPISMESPAGFYPDFYPLNEPIAPGSMVLTEICAGYGNYFGKLWGCFFVGEPTRDYRRMFDVAAGVHDRLARELRPGMTGRDIDAYLAPIAAAGLEQPANYLVGGWSALNHAPAMGAMDSSVSLPVTRPYADLPLQPSQTVTLHVWVRIPGTNKGLWLGSSGAITGSGFESHNSYPVSTLRVAPL